METGNTKDQRPVLVLGGTGKTGRRVAERLTARDVPVRIGSRGATPPFDWENPATWGPAVEGTRAVYLSFQPDLAVPGAVQAIAGFVTQAMERGTRRVVLLSGRGEPEAQAAERIVQTSGVDWTIVRCSWFAQNFSETDFREMILGGEMALPAGEIGEPFVDADDIADVAVKALTEDGHAGQLYELTGPRLLTYAEAVGEIARATDREIHYIQISPDEFAAGMAEQGVPPEFIALLRYLFTTVLDGRNAHLTDGVQRALGRPPRDFAEFARDAAAAGVWSE